MILVPLLDLSWTRTIGSLQSWSPAPLRPVDISVLSTCSSCLLSVCSESSTSSLRSTVGCLRLHLEQEILYLYWCVLYRSSQNRCHFPLRSLFSSHEASFPSVHIHLVCSPQQQMWFPSRLFDFLFFPCRLMFVLHRAYSGCKAAPFVSRAKLWLGFDCSSIFGYWLRVFYVAKHWICHDFHSAISENLVLQLCRFCNS